MFALAQLTEIAPDSGTPGYVTAAVVVSAVLVLVYLVIVAFRVRDSANRLAALEERLDAAARQAPPVDDAPRAGAVGDPASVAAAADPVGGER